MKTPFCALGDIVTEASHAKVYLENNKNLEDTMTTNVGTIDRILRAALGVVLLYLAFFSGLPTFEAPLFKYGAAIIGIVMLVVAAVRVCPIYSIFGFKTCRS